MAYDRKLADRIRACLEKRAKIIEKAMFGGICFLADGKMVCGVINDDLIVRVDPEASEALLKQAGVRPFDFSGRTMKGFLYVGPKALNTDKKLAGWLERSLEYVIKLPPKKKQ
jgi:TfoX/Sxy family transcriptional regulator of competence genes